MPLPQESVNTQLQSGKLTQQALDTIKRDIAALCREARGPHNNLSGRDAADAHPMTAITGLVDALASLTLSLAEAVATDDARVAIERQPNSARPQPYVERASSSFGGYPTGYLAVPANQHRVNVVTASLGV